MTRQAWDVIVIGGGVAGLTSAALLGKRGLHVVLLEARQELGGLTSTAELAPGVSCDVVDHEVGWVPSELLSELGLERSRAELAHIAPSVTTLVPGAEPLTISPDMQRTREALARISSHDAAAWPAFAERVSRLSEFLKAMYVVPPPSLFASGAGNLMSMLGIGRKARSLGRAGIFDILRTLPMSIADVLDETFEHDAVKGLLASRAVTRIQQGPRSGATAFLFLHNHVGLPAGAVGTSVAPQGGVGRLVRALATVAKSHGVEIRTSARVVQIRVHQERVMGVVLESGEEIKAARVASSLDVRRTVYDLIEPEHIEPELSRAVGNVRMRSATAKVNFVIEGTLPVSDESRDATFVVAPTSSYLERGFDQAKHGAVSDEPFLEIRALGGDMVPPNERRGVSVLVQWAPYSLQSGTWESSARDALGDIVLRTIERVMPGFTTRVVQRQVLSPLDIEAQYGATGGSLTHGELALDQMLFMRPVPALSRYRFPNIEGLYLCGRGCHPGMPLPAAMLAVREITRRGKDSARDVAAARSAPNEATPVPA